MTHHQAQSQSTELDIYNTTVVNSNFGNSGEIQTVDGQLERLPLKQMEMLQRRVQRIEVECLMEKLLDEQQRVMDLKEQIEMMKSELHKKQCDLKKLKTDSWPSSFLLQDKEIAFGETGALTGEVSSILSSSGETCTWQTASLPQLLATRKRMISAIYIISDLIINKRLLSIPNDGHLNDVQEENESAIEASLYRLYGEAFHVKTIQDTKDLHSLAEDVYGIEADVFSSALSVLLILTDSGSLLEESEKQQQFLNDSINGITPDWCDQYTCAMRQLIVSFLMNSQNILETHRADLEKITQHELAHTAFLRAAQGRPVIPLSVWCLSLENVLQHPDEGNMMIESHSPLVKGLQVYSSRQCRLYCRAQSPRRSTLRTRNNMSNRSSGLFSASRVHSTDTQATPSLRRAKIGLDRLIRYREKEKRMPMYGHGVPFASRQQRQRVVRQNRYNIGSAESTEAESVRPLSQLTVSAQSSKTTTVPRTTTRRRTLSPNVKVPPFTRRRSEKLLGFPEVVVVRRFGSDRR